jgi:exoribonuclease II
MSVQVLFDEAGEFKLGTILEEKDATLQVEAASGRRAKVKAANVLLRFGGESLGDLLQRAEAIASDIDASFLWEVSAGAEFGFIDLAADYFGHKPSAVEAIGVAVKLHNSPMHFYKRGKGRYQAAPEENLKAALASVEKKKRQQAQIEAWVEQLKAKQLPDGWLNQVDKLLFKPDRNTLEVKAVEGACEALGADMVPARLLGEAGAFNSAEAFHLRQFMHEHFANGVHQPPEPYRMPEEIALTGEWPAIDVASLPIVEIKTFSIDDEATTEIDDAFSLTQKSDGKVELGIHIAAPALFVTPASEGEVIARRHLSTVYYPSGKVTMLSETLVQSATLKAGQRVPVLSLYLSLDTTSLNVTGTRTVLEQLTITDNLRLDALEIYFNDETVAANAVQGPYSAELLFLHRFASQLKVARGAANQNDRQDYSFRVNADHISITPRLRGGA